MYLYFFMSPTFFPTLTASSFKSTFFTPVSTTWTARLCPQSEVTFSVNFFPRNSYTPLQARQLSFFHLYMVVNATPDIDEHKIAANFISGGDNLYRLGTLYRSDDSRHRADYSGCLA